MVLSSYLLQLSMGREEEKSAYSDNKLAAIVTEKSSSNTRLCLHNCKLTFLNKIIWRTENEVSISHLKDS